MSYTLSVEIVWQFRQHVYVVGLIAGRVVRYVFRDIDAVVDYLTVRSVQVANDVFKEFGTRRAATRRVCAAANRRRIE